MNINHIMSANLAQLMQTVSISLLQSSLATQAAQAQVMLEDFTHAQQTGAPTHPTLGHNLDIKL